ncbi:MULTISPECIES: MFS transporter [unclassified Shinella]|jgi:metabolite-proton symporter|uniref:MFS transporter n=1 Tax=unclassified Shinella TaxID=2643062 RepID=UPI000682B5CA|nr:MULTISPECIES: MFS transporter [unclassified Shinella]KNY16074.1 MFS transporter [Shinella sp. SUS2]KOC73570.1 MFS transporter [Shinella sp. GWS1]MCO5149430.1 MHS family MFS transporter [Shinella sp.]MDC7262665.1 MHS family MFS transporter [Shinella sp. HY16]MDC7269560.1 MHS family MFS transporter [Shinella sp. YZ44]
MSDTLASGSPTATHSNRAGLNSPARVLFASLVGTTIEFFDFYVYATAAVLVFPTLFFPNSDPTTALLASFATFSIAFFARPLGAVVFGHYGDRVGRKTTLVAALLTMGVSTVIIGLLPSYETIGVLAPLLLALCRFGQGFGLGGEWGGAVLLATENAPPGKRSWYGMFPQLGAPVGLFLSSGVFWLLLHVMSQESLLAWGWRIPFVASIILIAVGLWVRLSITETPAFQKAIDKQERVEVPVVELFRNHKRSLVLGTFVALATFVLFYIGSAYLLSYNVKILKLPFVEALEVQLLGSVLFGLFIPLAGKLAERFGRREVLILTTVLIGAFSFLLPGLMTGGESGIFVFVILAMALMGMTYGLIGTALAAPFPTKVRYTGSSITFNFAGIFGASLAPYIATWLQANYGMTYVGYYLGLSAVITLVCILLSGKEEV